MTEPDETREPIRRKADAAPAGAHLGIAESRWPMATTVAVAAGIGCLKPSSLSLAPTWVFPVVWSMLLVILILGDPGKIDKRSERLRVLSIGLVSLVALGSLESTVALILELVLGGPDTNTAGPLLIASAIVWVTNIIAFSLLYWDLDSGGSAARAQSMPQYPDLAFPQMLTPALAPANWRPKFIDYLYLGFTNATAFSPTDVMPLAPWAKIPMAVQATVSLVILLLVVARAVNVLL